MYCHKKLIERTGKWHYHNIYIHPMTTRICSDKKEPIYKIIVREAKIGEQSEYMAWIWKNEKDFTMIFPSKIFNICFADGYKAEEEANHGKSYNVIIEEIEQLKQEDIP